MIGKIDDTEKVFARTYVEIILGDRIDWDAVESKSRSEELVYQRALIYLVLFYKGYGPTATAGIVGKDHTTVIHGLKYGDRSHHNNRFVTRYKNRAVEIKCMVLEGKLCDRIGVLVSTKKKYEHAISEIDKQLESLSKEN